MIQNTFYTLLTNHPRSSLADIVGADYVDPAFEAAHRHTICEQTSQLLFGDTQSSQHWITLVRQVVLNSPLNDYLTTTTQGQQQQLDSLSSQLRKYYTPHLLDPDTPLRPIGEFRGEDYIVTRGYVSYTSGTLQILKADHTVRLQLATTDNPTSVVFEDTAGFWLPLAEFTVNTTVRPYIWATRPLESLGQRFESRRSTLTPLITRMSSLGSVFTIKQLDELIEFTTLAHQAELAASATALLVAGHTAYMAEITL